MLDWMTLTTDAANLNAIARERLASLSSKIMRISPKGEVEYIVGTFESLRSDFCGLAWSLGDRLVIAGSPASVVNDNNVFGHSDPLQCALDMISFFERHTMTVLPKHMTDWNCSRIDVTENYFLGGQVAVDSALGYLQYAHTRGQNVERKNTTVYWNKSSILRSGKAYNKHQQIQKLIRQNKAYFTDEQQELTRGLLRLELKLGRMYFHRLDKHWSLLNEDDLRQEHERFFENCIGSIEVPTMNTLHDKLLQVAPTAGQATAAFNMFNSIKSLGYRYVKGTVSKPTFYRNQKLLLEAGLSKADLNAGQILEFRRKSIVIGEPVTSWDDLRKVAHA